MALACTPTEAATPRSSRRSSGHANRSSSARPTSRKTSLAICGTKRRTYASSLRARSEGVQTLFFVGSGGSWSSMYSGKYLADRLLHVPTELSLSYELGWRAPARLDERALVFVASYSGATADTLEALQFARSRGAR